MDNDFGRNAGLHAPPSSSFLTMANCSPVPSGIEADQDQCCLFSQNWETSTAPERSIFESALSSLVSSPATATNSGDIFMIREFIGKLGNTGSSSGEFLPSSSSSCYSTPLNSPPKLAFPATDYSKPNLSQTTPLGPSVAPELAADPGFAERAARFSRFGGRSFNSRTTPFSSPNTSDVLLGRSNAVNTPNGDLPRVGSTPAIAVRSQDESTVSHQIPGGTKFSGVISRKRKCCPEGKVKESSVGASPSTNPTKGEANSDDPNTKRSKLKEKITKEKCGVKAEEEEKQSKSNNAKPTEPPKDYIHVRARRGQATDSHSLAERVRREKISERMKLLQNLVPNCNKVTGKALMLDEIINYVQSLQRQVEFLSMKLASVNTRLDINVNSLMSKNMMEENKFPGAAFLGQQQQQRRPRHHSDPTLPSNPMNSLHQFDHSALLPSPLPSPSQGFPQNAPQTFYEDDLQAIVQMGFGQRQDFHDLNQLPTTRTSP